MYSGTYVGICIAQVHVCEPYICLVTKEGGRSPQSGLRDGCELPRECWELNLGLLKEKPMLLTTEASLQLQVLFSVSNFLSSLVTT